MYNKSLDIISYFWFKVQAQRKQMEKERMKEKEVSSSWYESF